MTSEDFARTEYRLGALLVELPGHQLAEFAVTARQRAASLTCATDRSKKCALNRLADLADDLDAALRDFNHAPPPP